MKWRLNLNNYNIISFLELKVRHILKGMFNFKQYN